VLIKLWLVEASLAFLLDCIKNWRVDSHTSRRIIGVLLCFLYT